VPLFISAFRRADELATAMECRCYHGGEGRTKLHVLKYEARDYIALTGGCAKNDGLKKAIEKVLKIKVVELSTDPQLMGALGAAEYARQKGLDR
jgi:hypothetical protein